MNRGDVITTKDGVESVIDIITDTGIYISGWGKKLNHPDRIFMTNKMFSELLTSKEAKITVGELVLSRKTILEFYVPKRLYNIDAAIEGLDKVMSEEECYTKVLNGKLEPGTKVYLRSEVDYRKIVDCRLPERGTYLLSETNTNLEDDNIRQVLTPEQMIKIFTFTPGVITKEQIAYDFGTTVLNLKLIE